MSTIYTPSNLIAALLISMSLKNDAALARRLQVTPPVISKIRRQTLLIGPSFLIAAHEESGISIKDMKDAAGMASSKNRSATLETKV